MDWEKVGFVIASRYRKEILLRCIDKLWSPAELAKSCGIILSHTSRTLRDLEKRGLIKCFTPTRKKGRIYGLTEEGREIAEYLKKRN